MPSVGGEMFFMNVGDCADATVFYLAFGGEELRQGFVAPFDDVFGLS